jgi:Ca2+-binding EF-hand superfamily protein
MKHLFTTTAIVAAMGCFSFAAQAEQTGVSKQSSYCDRPWAQIDSNSDGFVSEMEAGAAADNQFAQIDSDGDGKIIKPEWAECLTRGGQQGAESDRSEQNFADADANQDQQITRDEFRRGSQEAYESAQSDAAGDNSYVILRRYVFLTPEESGDGSTVENMSSDEAAGRSALTFGALDQNGDDIIEAQEWAERSPAIDRNQDWANAEFDRIDGDANGSITQSEYRTARQQMLDDNLTTGSVNNDTTAGESSAKTEEGSASAASAASGAGIPVYIYRFSTM